jgi:hypothetical protein
VFAVETKFTSISWRQSEDALVSPFGDPLGQAADGARKVRLLLGSKGHVVSVTPVLLAWGSGARQLRRAVINGVMVLPGSDLKSWMSEIHKAAILPKEEIRGIERSLACFIREREEYERTVSR